VMKIAKKYFRIYHTEFGFLFVDICFFWLIHDFLIHY